MVNMSDSEVKKTVFLVSSNIKTKEVTVVKRAALNFLFQFHRSNPSSSKPCYKQFGENVKWSFRFLVKNPQKYSMLQEWKELRYSEIRIFEQELERFHQNKKNFHEDDINGTALCLSEALKSVVHDYSWDDHGLISPVKRPTKRSSQSTKSSGSTLQYVEKFSSNIVVIIAPLPRSQSDLDKFFDWQSTDQEYVCRKLMPPHLRTYFKQKYDITLLWMDTSLSSHQCTQNDQIGLSIIRNFLKSLGGDALPITAFGDFNSTSGFDMVREMGSYPFLYNPKESTNSKSDKKGLVIHVTKTIRKSEEESIDMQKLFTLSSHDKSINSSSLNQLFNYPCPSCSKRFLYDPNSSHRLQLSADRTKIHVDIGAKNSQETHCDRELKIQSNMQDVLVILGKYQKEQVSLLLGHPEIVEISSVWCEMKWYSRCNLNLWKGAFVAEVLKYCTTCCTESSAEELGIKYAIVEIKTKNIATIAYLRLKSSALLNPSCWLQNQDSFNPVSPIKTWKDSRKRKHQSPMESNVLMFCSSMMEDWYLMNPLPANCGIILPTSKQSYEKSAQKELMHNLSKYYKEKYQSKQQSCSGDTIPSDPALCEGIRPLNDSRTLLQLRDNLLEVIEKVTFSDLTMTQINNVIRATNSLFTAIKYNHIKSDPCLAEYFEKLKDAECFHSTADIKQLSTKSDQIKLSVMHMMLLVKFAESYLKEEELPDVMNDAISHLRFISLTSGHATMITLLEKVLVEKFFDVCGKLLYEIYNELMLPIPAMLQAYSREEEDTTHSDSVLFSVNSFNSQASNVTSSKSCGVADVASRRQRFGTSSVSQLRRIIEIPSQTVDDPTKGKEKSDKLMSRAESSTKNKSIIRDLFSAQDKPHEEKAIFESPDGKRQRKIYVSETPKVKQHMTAFTRQSLRMQKKHASDGSLQGITVIEESPAKPEGSEVLNDPKSSKLTRRHSFYCDGKDSRNVTRAKSLQQLQQGVLATPLTNAEARRTRSMLSPKIGRKSLSSLFHSPIIEKPDNQDADQTVFAHAEDLISPVKIGPKCQGSLFQSPLKARSIESQDMEVEQVPTNSEIVKSPESSSKVWRRSLTGLFHSPLLSASSGGQMEPTTEAGQITHNTISPGSSDVFEMQPHIIVEAQNICVPDTSGDNSKGLVETDSGTTLGTDCQDNVASVASQSTSSTRVKRNSESALLRRSTRTRKLSSRN